MNERIKQLAMQTDIWCDQILAHGSPMYNNQWEQKFAELIVRECAKVADIADENKCEWIGGNILTHFGVKE